MTHDDRRPTVLVEDDEATIRRTVSRLLERAGYRVRAVATGEEAVALIQGEHFDAAICDLHMPGMSGARLCEQIWLAAPDLAAHLIVVSGDPENESADRQVARSGVPPVRKPFTGADLLQALGAICPLPPAPPSVRQAAS